MAEKVLAFFGAFNPVTKAHIDVAKCALKQTEATKVIFIPSKSQYIQKVQKKDKSFKEDIRLMLLRKVAKSYPWMEVSDIEIKKESQPLTYDTLCELKSKGYSPTLLVGEDVFCDFQLKWKNVHKICEEFGVVVAERVVENIEQDAESLIMYDPFYKSLPNIDMVTIKDANTLCASSTATRTIIAKIEQLSDTLKQCLPEEVYSDFLKMILFS